MLDEEKEEEEEVNSLLCLRPLCHNCIFTRHWGFYFTTHNARVIPGLPVRISIPDKVEGYYELSNWLGMAKNGTKR